MKSKSYLLLLFLLLVLVFIIGVRYGQRVEKTNKIINYLLSITPSLSPTPTPLKYATTEGKMWKIKYIHPSHLKIKEDPSQSAVIIQP